MLLFITGLLISAVYTIYILPIHEGVAPSIKPTVYPVLYKGMVIFPYSKQKALHLHHWIIYLCVCLSGLYLDIPKSILGFSFGLFIQGLTYKDSFKFVTRNPYN